MTPTIEELARGLTEAQKSFILALDGMWQMPKQIGKVACPSNTANRDRRLIERPIEAAGTPLRLTPLGLTLRAYLEKTHG